MINEAQSGPHKVMRAVNTGFLVYLMNYAVSNVVAETLKATSNKEEKKDISLVQKGLNAIFSGNILNTKE